MTAYKLVVVSPFESFKRGDQIFDQVLVKKISDPKGELHEYERNVRRVAMSAIEKQQYVNESLPVNKMPPKPEPIHEPVEMKPLNIESIKEIGE